MRSGVPSVSSFLPSVLPSAENESNGTTSSSPVCSDRPSFHPLLPSLVRSSLLPLRFLVCLPFLPSILPSLRDLLSFLPSYLSLPSIVVSLIHLLLSSSLFLPSFVPSFLPCSSHLPFFLSSTPSFLPSFLPFFSTHPSFLLFRYQRWQCQQPQANPVAQQNAAAALALPQTRQVPPLRSSSSTPLMFAIRMMALRYCAGEGGRGGTVTTPPPVLLHYSFVTTDVSPPRKCRSACPTFSWEIVIS